mgnify:CR=1 FL=1
MGPVADRERPPGVLGVHHARRGLLGDRRDVVEKLAAAGANFVIWGPDVDGTPGRYVRTDNTAAIELYKKHGFSIIAERPNYYGPDIAAYMMERPNLVVAND